MVDVHQLITNPDRFFEKTANQFSLRWPSIIVFAAALMSVSTTLVIALKLAPALSGGAGIVTLFAFFIGSLSGVAVTLILWFVNTGVFFLFSSRFGGSGDFRKLFKFIGWGYLPVFLAGVINLVLLLQAASGIEPVQSMEAATRVSSQLQSHPLLRVSNVLNLIFSVWQGFIWVFALHHARNIGLRAAAICVALPVGLSVMLKLWNMISL